MPLRKLSLMQASNLIVITAKIAFVFFYNCHTRRDFDLIKLTAGPIIIPFHTSAIQYPNDFVKQL